MTIARAQAIGLPSKYAWENMVGLLKVNGGAQQLYDMFHDNNGSDNFIQQLDRLFGTNDFMFRVNSPELHSRIMEVMNDVDIDTTGCEIDPLGWVYEQHLRTGASTARDLGQFFTSRSICKYMVELCDPHIRDDGTPETICDPTMGTGGFLTTIIRRYSTQFSVNWHEYVNSIHGCDSDGKVAAIARMNVFMETNGVISLNMITRNSLYDGLPARMYDILIANPPFGLHEIEYDRCCEEIHNFDVVCTDSDTLFLQLVMMSLAPGGRAAIIMPGTFLDGAGQSVIMTRRRLIEDFCITHIIEMRGNVFTNTTITTFIIVFTNNEFSTGDITVMRLTKNPDSNAIHNEIIDTITRQDIDRNNFSLDLRYYISQPILREPVTPEEVNVSKQMFKLVDVCEIRHGKSISPSLFTSEGLAVIKQKNISSGRLIISQKQDYIPRDIASKYVQPIPGDVVISTAYDCGRCALVNTRDWILTNHICIVRSCDTAQLRPMYLFWYLYSGGFYDMMQYVQHGIGVKGIRCDDINNAMIYVPSVDEQDAIIARFVSCITRSREAHMQIATLTQEISRLVIDMRRVLNPLFNDDAVPEHQSLTRAQRSVFPII
jgi:predicted RNA methylase